jgi:twinkle protein
MTQLWDAAAYMPERVIDVADRIEEYLHSEPGKTISTPWEGLNKALAGGLPAVGLLSVGAGTNVGKSTFIRELIYWCRMHHKIPVGALLLEESSEESFWAFVAMHSGKRVDRDPKLLTENEARAAAKELFNGPSPIYMYEYDGGFSLDSMLNDIRYMVRGLGCQVIFLDHLSYIISGMTGGDGLDERVTIDRIVHALSALAKELHCSIVLVSQLRRPAGDEGYEEGKQPHLSSFRGSQAVPQLSRAILGLERNISDGAAAMDVRVLKQKRGEVGAVAATLQYDSTTGRLAEADTDIYENLEEAHEAY